MAKALFGHTGGTDVQMVAEMRRLQQRVRELEQQLRRLQLENDALRVSQREDAIMGLRVDEKEPALA